MVPRRCPTYTVKLRVTLRKAQDLLNIAQRIQVSTLERSLACRETFAGWSPGRGFCRGHMPIRPRRPRTCAAKPRGGSPSRSARAASFKQFMQSPPFPCSLGTKGLNTASVLG